MLNRLIEVIKNLPLSDKYLAGVSLAILVNPTLSLFAAGLTLTYVVWKIGKDIEKS